MTKLSIPFIVLTALLAMAGCAADETGDPPPTSTGLAARDEGHDGDRDARSPKPTGEGDGSMYDGVARPVTPAPPPPPTEKADAEAEEPATEPPPPPAPPSLAITSADGSYTIVGANDDRCSTGGDALSFVFTNQRAVPVTISWIDYSCAPLTYATVAPGQSIAQNTFTTHRWRIADATSSYDFVLDTPSAHYTVTAR